MLEKTWQGQAKNFRQEYMLKFTEDLLNKEMRTVKLIVELLTEHCKLTKHMSNLFLS